MKEAEHLSLKDRFFNQLTSKDPSPDFESAIWLNHTVVRLYHEKQITSEELAAASLRIAEIIDALVNQLMDSNWLATNQRDLSFGYAGRLQQIAAECRLRVVLLNALLHPSVSTVRVQEEQP